MSSVCLVVFCTLFLEYVVHLLVVLLYSPVIKVVINMLNSWSRVIWDFNISHCITKLMPVHSAKLYSRGFILMGIGLQVIVALMLWICGQMESYGSCSKVYVMENSVIGKYNAWGSFTIVSTKVVKSMPTGLHLSLSISDFKLRPMTLKFPCPKIRCLALRSPMMHTGSSCLVKLNSLWRSFV